MRVLGNILWFILGGAVLALVWALAGLLLCVTLVGIPFGLQCFKLAGLTLFPFGYTVTYRTDRTGCASVFLNLIWILLFGWELALCFLITGLLMCVTLIGIPFGLQAFKLARLALIPFGADVVRIA